MKVLAMMNGSSLVHSKGGSAGKDAVVEVVYKRDLFTSLFGAM